MSYKEKEKIEKMRKKLSGGELNAENFTIYSPVKRKSIVETESVSGYAPSVISSGHDLGAETVYLKGLADSSVAINIENLTGNKVFQNKNEISIKELCLDKELKIKNTLNFQIRFLTILNVVFAFGFVISVVMFIIS